MLLKRLCHGLNRFCGGQHPFKNVRMFQVALLNVIEDSKTNLESYNTSFNNIDANITYTRIDQFPNKLWWSVMNIDHTKSILGSQSGCSSHSVTSVDCNHFLIGFQTPVLIEWNDQHLRFSNGEEETGGFRHQLTLHRSCPSQLLLAHVPLPL
jgi:hypothetical protein